MPGCLQLDQTLNTESPVRRTALGTFVITWRNTTKRKPTEQPHIQDTVFIKQVLVFTQAFHMFCAVGYRQSPQEKTFTAVTCLQPLSGTIPLPLVKSNIQVTLYNLQIIILPTRSVLAFNILCQLWSFRKFYF